MRGDLGVGKTTFTQMIAKQLGVKEKVNSPTFTICQQYQIKNNYYLNHFDFFRLSPKDDLCYFQELTSNNLNIIEWPEKNPQFWQGEEYINLTFRIQPNEVRVIRVRGIAIS